MNLDNKKKFQNSSELTLNNQMVERSSQANLTSAMELQSSSELTLNNVMVEGSSQANGSSSTYTPTNNSKRCSFQFVSWSTVKGLVIKNIIKLIRDYSNSIIANRVTPHSKGNKEISNNSTWDFDPIFILGTHIDWAQAIFVFSENPSKIKWHPLE